MIACVVALCLAASARLIDFRAFEPRFDVDPSMASLLPRSGPALETYLRTQHQFNDDDLLLVAWIDDDLFTSARLAALKALTQALERLPDVVAVESLARISDIRISTEQTRIDPFLRHVPDTADELAALRSRALANPLVRGRLLSDDGRAALLAVHFTPGLSSAELTERVDAVRRASRAGAGGIEQFVSGPLLVRLEISRILLRDLYRVMPLAVCATLLVALIGFGSLRGVVLPMFGNLAAALVTLAVFVSAGHGLNFVTVILPPVIYVVGFAYAIHVVSEFDRHFDRSTSRAAATRTALREVWLPLTLTAATTAIAFAALGFSAIDSIRTFGRYAALGVVLAWIGALSVVPAGLVLLRGAPCRPPRLLRVASCAATLARVALAYRRTILLAATVVAIGAALASLAIRVDTQVLRNFGPHTTVQQHFQRVAEIFAGPVPMRIVIDGEPDAFKDPRNLRAVAALARWLKADPEIGGVYALSDYVALLNQAIAPESAALDPLPDAARMVNHLLLVGGSHDAGTFVNPAYSSTLLHLRTSALSTAAVNDLARRITVRLAELPGSLRAEVTGTSYLIARTVDDITRGQVASLGFALLVVFAFLSLLFGSLRIGLLALVPNALPVVVYFGLLGISGIPLNLTTSLVACAVFGIAIDDSVHFLSRFAIESHRHDDPQRAMTVTMATILRPVTLTTAALCAGFVALCAGELRAQAEFGMLAAATLGCAWLVDITFTPALCCRLRVRPIWARRSLPG